MKSMDKNTLRKIVLEARKKISIEDQIVVTDLILEKLKNHEVFKASSHIGLYYPIQQEINLLSLIEIYPDKHFYMPNIENGTIKYRLIERLDSLVDASFGLKEAPFENNLIEDCELYLIPCVATSKQLRIGYGKGYFDRYLVGKKGYKLGITYPQHKFDYDLNEPHDILLDEVL